MACRLAFRADERADTRRRARRCATTTPNTFLKCLRAYYGVWKTFPCCQTKTPPVLFSHGRVGGIVGIVADICPLRIYHDFGWWKVKRAFDEAESGKPHGVGYAASVFTSRVTISEAPLGL